ncbi:MAG: secretin and TonB N-terminal domain-containing protein [Cyanobacteria bacterium]|nr:secretin and TonB N-terminal domain-containing protein [Cyanobacteriota bacterium]
MKATHSINAHKALEKYLIASLSVACLAYGLPLSAHAQYAKRQDVPSNFNQPQLEMPQNLPVRGEISIGRQINMARENEKVSMYLRDVSIRDVLNLIAKQGNFNVIIDESVTGNVSVDIKNISINKALDYIFTIGNLSYNRDGNTLIIATTQEASNKNLNAKTFKAIPVLYKNATLIATQLNQTLFSIPVAGSSNRAIAASDPDSNSLLIMGTDSDIQLVNKALRELDVPRNRKVYHVRYNPPASIAQLLAANFFGFGAPTSGFLGSSGGGGGSAAAGAAPAAAPGAPAVGAAAPAAGGAAPAAAAAPAAGAAGGGVANPGVVPTILNAGGVTFISEAVSSTLTVLATDEQLALIDSLINEVDVRRPQVSIEVSLMEIQNTTSRSFIPTYNQVNLGSYHLNLFADGNASNLNFVGGRFLPNRLTLTAPATNLPFQASFSDSRLKGKILANPNVVALDGTTSRIEITDEIPTINTTTTVTNGLSIITSTITKQNAGITLDITPRISNDGSVTLTMKPQVTQPLREVRVVNAGNITSTFLLSIRSLDVNSARVRDGDTLVIGGLLRDSSSEDLRKVPFLSDLPIVGAMLRSTPSATRGKTELVLMVTPHILKEDAVTYFTQPGGMPNHEPFSDRNHAGVMPTALPRIPSAQNTSSSNTGRIQIGEDNEEVSPSPSKPSKKELPMMMNAVAEPPVKLEGEHFVDFTQPSPSLVPLGK